MHEHLSSLDSWSRTDGHHRAAQQYYAASEFIMTLILDLGTQLFKESDG
jgi:hypothetical protein